MLEKKSDMDRLEKIIDRIGVGLTDSELAQCVNKLFLDNGPLYQQLGVRKTLALYLTAMRMLHARIVEFDKSVGDCGNWLLVNGYWPLPVVGAKG